MMISPALISQFPGFDHCNIDVGPGVQIAATIGGSGPPLLLLHGHPQTRAIWHRVAPASAERHTIVAADLRGYGDSSKPEGGPDHASYSKRVMAHEQTSDDFARAYWHWFFLIQDAPLPERLIQSDPPAYVRDVIGRRHAGLAPFDPRALSEYERCIALAGTAHAICEDYRAAAGIDLVHDGADRDAEHLLKMPVLALWGRDGVVHRCFKPLDEWQWVAIDVAGVALPCGHYIAEEAPRALLDEVVPFLANRLA
jgi:haloacetate dehalogenase